MFLKINPIHGFTITDNFPKFHVYPSAYVGAIQATTYYDINLTKSPSKKAIPLTYFSENQSHPCSYYYWQLPQVSCIFINKCRRYPSDSIWWHTDGLTDGWVKNIILTQLSCIGYNNLFTSLPTPNRETISYLCKSIFEFPWRSNVDKVKRSVITQDYLSRGIKMVDLNNFITSLKCTWIKRLIKSNSHKPWMNIFCCLKKYMILEIILL
jgi:hypothetical protein